MTARPTTPDAVRQSYLDFFVERAHTLVGSASLVPENDPSLLFTGAGMNQFKDEFLGRGRRGLVRATTSQKCLRTGDLENVGRTAGHQSFFEMLGNFSFGDYFKREAIAWAWEYLTTVLAMDPSLLHVTVFEDDDEAYGIWQDDVGLPEERIHRFGAKSNYWPANAPADGPNGPCGPCSEIFVDTGELPDCPDRSKCDPECDCRRYEEVWNLVFTQFERRDGGELVPLPQRNIDTGMGFERVVRILEGAPTNLDSSLFAPIRDAVAAAAGRERYERDGEDGVRMRRIADHVRAACFLVGDGVRPGNEGRGYVLRRILRRAIRDGAGLGVDGAFLDGLVPSVIEAMGDAYPDLRTGRDLLAGVLRAEERLFLRTFRNGMRRLEAAVEGVVEAGGSELDAEEVFRLHDTYGFPVDVTAEILAERGLGFDRDEYERHMRAQRDRSRAAQKMTDDIFERGPAGIVADAGAAETEFVGYDDPGRDSPEERRGVLARATVSGIVLLKDGRGHREVRDGEEAIVVLDRSPFYSEAGGQVSDTGAIDFEDGGTLTVTEVSHVDGYTLHRGTYNGTEPGPVGGTVLARVDEARRDSVRRNHTATHLLHRALKDLLGEGCHQAGSHVGPDRLRFDFTHDRSLTTDQIDALERAVNAEVLANARLDTDLMSVEAAKESGAVALFGEKYPDPVRVVAVGEYSRELCGGTHCRAAGDIGQFRIVGEGSIAAGIRRVEAVTGDTALNRMQDDRTLLASLAKQVNAPAAEIAGRFAKLAAEAKALRKEVERLRPPFAAVSGTPIEARGASVYVHLTDEPRAALVKAAEALRKDDGAAVAALMVTNHGGKVAAVSAANPAAVEAGLDAVTLLRGSGGRGGGRPVMAQGTVPPPASAEALRDAVEAALAGG